MNLLILNPLSILLEQLRLEKEKLDILFKVLVIPLTFVLQEKHFLVEKQKQQLV